MQRKNFSGEHPHPDKRHVMSQYRRHIMNCKKKWSSARGLIHYRALVATYLAAKRSLMERSHG
jgi:hypothetical protein